MVFVLLFPYFYVDPLPSLYWWAVSVGVGEDLKWHQLATPLANEPAKDLILVHTVQLKPIDKSTFLRKNVI